MLYDNRGRRNGAYVSYENLVVLKVSMRTEQVLACYERMDKCGEEKSWGN